MDLTRRDFLALAGATALGSVPRNARSSMSEIAADNSASAVTLFLAGDVMLGRGIDRVLPHPGDPRIYEPYVASAQGYVDLAESAHGPIPRPVDYAYVWGDALAALEKARPDARLVNLETSITRSERPAPKEIHYRMNPENAPVLKAAAVDACMLANNHVLDWGPAGLLETLDTLARAGIRAVGAGRDAVSAAAPAAIEVAGKRRVVVFAFGSESSGIPSDWAAGQSEPGVNLLRDLSDRTVARVASAARAARRPGDVLVASLHWGPNWGYEITGAQRSFAHALIDAAGFDVLFGHSSHHPMGIEIYKRKPILYGCGDFLNDYEGIGGYESYRGDLALMYLPRISISSGELIELRMLPFQVRRFRLNRAAPEDAIWLRDRLDRESARLGTRVAFGEDGSLTAAPG